MLILFLWGVAPLLFVFPHARTACRRAFFRCQPACGLVCFSYCFESAKLSISADMTKFLQPAFTILIK